MNRAALTLTAMILMAACASRGGFLDHSYRSLAADQVAYERLTKVAFDKWDRGELTDAQIDQIIDITGGWAQAHNLAVSALEVYLISRSEDDRQNFVSARLALSSVLADVNAVLSSLGVLGGQIGECRPRIIHGHHGQPIRRYTRCE